MTRALEDEPGAHPVPEISGFERRVWLTQRVAWVLMTAALLLAVAGGLGPGALSRATVVSPDGSLSLQYERVMRVNHQTAMEWRIRPDTGMAAIDLTPAFRSLISVKELAPLPEGSILIDSVERVRFRARTTQPVTVRLEVEARAPGRHHLQARAAGGGWVTLTLWVLP